MYHAALASAWSATTTARRRWPVRSGQPLGGLLLGRVQVCRGVDLGQLDHVRGKWQVGREGFVDEVVVVLQHRGRRDQDTRPLVRCGVFAAELHDLLGPGFP